MFHWSGAEGCQIRAVKSILIVMRNLGGGSGETGTRASRQLEEGKQELGTEMPLLLHPGTAIVNGTHCIGYRIQKDMEANGGISKRLDSL